MIYLKSIEKVEIKICSKCNEVKNYYDFNKSNNKKNGLRSECRVCQNFLAKKYREKNCEKINQSHIEWKKNNPEKYRLHKKINKITYRVKHSDKVREHHRKYMNEKYKNDIFYSLSSKLRSRLNIFIKSKNIKKQNKTFEIIGCSPEFLKIYIENQFTEGMSWELMGKYIHIDHIIPLSSANNEEEVYKLCHYTNLQPLWSEDNLKKGDKIL